MHFSPRINSFKFVSAFLFLTIFSIPVFAGSGNSGSPYHKEHNPIHAGYFGYGLVKPGFAVGSEIGLLWTKVEKGGCRGAKVSDRHITFIPTIGAFQNEENTVSVFGNVELNFQVTYRHGFTFEVFGAPGYAQMLSGAENVNKIDNTGAIITNEAHSGFMPWAGIGMGYDFQKLNGKDCPLELDFRGLATTTDFANMDILPAFQAGIIYNF